MHFTIYGCSLHPLRTYQSVLARLLVSPRRIRMPAALDSQRANRLPLMLSAAKWLLDCNGCYRAPGELRGRLTSQAPTLHNRSVHQSVR